MSKQAISVKDVGYLAYLARLQLSEEELKTFAGQLDEILAYVAKLKAARTDAVAPTSHVLPISNVFREDEVVPSLPVGEGLANAPDREGPFFRVPRIIEPTD